MFRFNTNVNYCLLGYIKAAFEHACEELDRMHANMADGALSKAFEALLEGDTRTRDELCAWMLESPDNVFEAKIEIWHRLCQGHGLTRGQADEYILELQKMGGFKWGMK